MFTSQRRQACIQIINSVIRAKIVICRKSELLEMRIKGVGEHLAVEMGFVGFVG